MAGIPGKRIDLIGVPIDIGAGRRGVRLGPNALRAAGVLEQLKSLGCAVRDCGDVVVPESNERDLGGPGRPRHVAAIRQACLNTAAAVEASLRDGAFPVVMGGDHSLATGALAGCARVVGAQGLIWIDAHADMNSPDSTPTGNLHGMSLASALGDAPEIFPNPEFHTPSVDPTRTVFVGLRDLDPHERQAIRERGMTAFTMTDIDRFGMAHVVDRAIETAGRGAGSAHISVDIDSVDPAMAPGTGTPVPGGLTYREAHLAMEMLAESGVAHSMELTEVNPALDDHNVTARFAVGLICSLLGKRII
jgi:arginase